MSEINKKLYLETYGCQMNMADSELVLSLLNNEGFTITENINDANVILVNTCSVREHAEQRIYGRLGKFKSVKNKNPEVVVGILGCMAERLRSSLISDKAKGVGQIVDVIVGPDEYRKLPELVYKAWHGEKGIAVQLSRIETYDDISPLRTNGISAWISVMRGCDKFCSFCVVPFTRGRERSRPFESIIQEVENLAKRGFKEVTLLGQNVNSYKDQNNKFNHLLSAVASVDNSMRIRFTTSHPQDMPDELIETIAKHKNICKYIHLPVQSGSDRILELMNRNYNIKHYQHLINKIRTAMPDVCLSTDFITGFPTETDEDHQKTLELMDDIRFDGAFMFKYSARENTPAYKMADNVADEIKSHRINEIIELQNQISTEINQTHVGRRFEILVEGESKKSPDEWQGRTDGNKTVIFPKGNYSSGEYAEILIERVNSATLFGKTFKTTIMEEIT